MLTEPTKLQTGSSSTAFSTATPCTVVLAPGASFELDTITLIFGGQFTVQGGNAAQVALYRATPSLERWCLSRIRPTTTS